MARECDDAGQLPSHRPLATRTRPVASTYLGPATGEVLVTWGEALDAIGSHDAPLHVVRFGAKFDAQGVLAGSKDSGRCIRYLTKYLTKQISACHTADTDAQQARAARLLDAMRKR